MRVRAGRSELDPGHLSGARLSRATLIGSNLMRANLSGATLREADLSDVDLRGANLSSADLSRAELIDTNLSRANMSCANMTGARLFDTIFADINLSDTIGLETCLHHGPSIIDHRTLHKSGPLPVSFLRGVGLPDTLIDYLPSLFNQAIQYFSCFISYSAQDQEFADRFHADVRCWFAPHDLRIGERILDELHAAIRLRDKVMLILSEHSITSEWVEDEVTKAFEEERKRGKTVLFPIRLDNAVMETGEAWAAKLRARHIGDFRYWKDHDAYQKSFERVMRDLTVNKKAPD